jgi:hypothetical protein
MTERGILFSAPMVRALLDGTKTQTRRAVKPYEAHIGATAAPADVVIEHDGFAHRSCPYGLPGDRLWVRETFFAYGRWETRYNDKKQRDEWRFVDMTVGCDRTYQYAADNPDVPLAKGRGALPGWYARPAIHMPRVASRILLEIVAVRVERLQDISEADSRAEGIAAVDGTLDDAKVIDMAKRMGRRIKDAAPRYAAIWESINGAGSWGANPWVWVVEFRRIG